MQNSQSLIDLGFVLNDENYYELKGTHQTFLAKVWEEGSNREYVRLCKLHRDIDLRPRSERNGKHFIAPIKDCITNNSVAIAIEKYDVPEDQFSYVIGGCFLKERSKKYD